LGRRWNIDPVILPWQSSYSTFDGNPIMKSDVLGNSAENDIIINESGTVTQVIENDKPDRLFIDTEGKRQEITLHDTEFDRGQLGSAKVGEKLVHFLTPENQMFMISEGAKYAVLRGLPVASECVGVLDAAVNSFGSRDYGSTLANQLCIEGMRNSAYNNTPSPGWNYLDWDTKGGFVFFMGAGEYRAYNIPDAGNFLWGAGMHYSNISFILSKIGSNLNEASRGYDSESDQLQLPKVIIIGVD
jgi:hypothetical protein